MPNGLRANLRTVPQVYDVSKFLKEHPGGSSIVIPHLGTDISDIFVDEDMHVHSKAAHSMLARYRIGILAAANAAAAQSVALLDLFFVGFGGWVGLENRMLCVDACLSGLALAGILAGAAARKSGDAGPAVKFDWNKPIVFQIGHLGEHYNEFIHTPQVLDEPARFFESGFLEFFSRTPWYVVPIVWVPVVMGMLLHASTLGLPTSTIASVYASGLALWTLIEYVLHRW